jgi:hypothetical protein
MDGQIERLVGDVFLGAACISYYGAFNGAYRWAGGAEMLVWPAGLHAALPLHALQTPCMQGATSCVCMLLWQCHASPAQ